MGTGTLTHRFVAVLAIAITATLSGSAQTAPYDAIIVAASAPDLPRPLIEQLSVGGKLIIPVGDDESQVLKLVQREPSGFHQEDLGECRFVKLWGKFGWQD